jgi:pimeloyl-ACP methyl ester carboxylesterase
MLADLISILEAFELDRVFLISHDMGSISGFALSFDHPERVKAHLALGVPPPFIKFSRHLLSAMKHLWFQQALAIPGLGAQLVSEQRQRLPRYLFEHFTLDAASWSAEVIETYVAQLREPDRARAASSLYRHLVLPESLRILRGDYRRIRLPTPTLLLFGAADSAFPPALANRMLQDHRTYADHVEVGFVARAAHFIADERPDAVVDHALEFFPRHATGL